MASLVESMEFVGFVQYFVPHLTSAPKCCIIVGKFECTLDINSLQCLAGMDIRIGKIDMTACHVNDVTETSY